MRDLPCLVCKTLECEHQSFGGPIRLKHVDEHLWEVICETCDEAITIDAMKLGVSLPNDPAVTGFLNWLHIHTHSPSRQN
jgi:hypothetical protein